MTECANSCGNGSSRYRLKISQKEMFFNIVPVGDVSPISEILLENVGWEDILLQSISITGPYTLIRTDCPDVLKPGQKGRIGVIFVPTSYGPWTGAVFIMAGRAGDHNIRLIGAGLDTGDNYNALVIDATTMAGATNYDKVRAAITLGGVLAAGSVVIRGNSDFVVQVPANGVLTLTSGMTLAHMDIVLTGNSFSPIVFTEDGDDMGLLDVRINCNDYNYTVTQTGTIVSGVGVFGRGCGGITLRGVVIHDFRGRAIDLKSNWATSRKILRDVELDGVFIHTPRVGVGFGMLIGTDTLGGWVKNVRINRLHFFGDSPYVSADRPRRYSADAADWTADMLVCHGVDGLTISNAILSMSGAAGMSLTRGCRNVRVLDTLVSRTEESVNIGSAYTAVYVADMRGFEIDNPTGLSIFKPISSGNGGITKGDLSGMIPDDITLMPTQTNGRLSRSILEVGTAPDRVRISNLSGFSVGGTVTTTGGPTPITIGTISKIVQSDITGAILGDETTSSGSSLTGNGWLYLTGLTGAAHADLVTYPQTIIQTRGASYTGPDPIPGWLLVTPPFGMSNFSTSTTIQQTAGVGGAVLVSQPCIEVRLGLENAEIKGLHCIDTAAKNWPGQTIAVDDLTSFAVGESIYGDAITVTIVPGSPDVVTPGPLTAGSIYRIAPADSAQADTETTGEGRTGKGWLLIDDLVEEFHAAVTSYRQCIFQTSGTITKVRVTDLTGFTVGSAITTTGGPSPITAGTISKISPSEYAQTETTTAGQGRTGEGWLHLTGLTGAINADLVTHPQTITQGVTTRSIGKVASAWQAVRSVWAYSEYFGAINCLRAKNVRITDSSYSSPEGFGRATRLIHNGHGSVGYSNMRWQGADAKAEVFSDAGAEAVWLHQQHSEAPPLDIVDEWLYSPVNIPALGVGESITLTFDLPDLNPGHWLQVSIIGGASLANVSRQVVSAVNGKAVVMLENRSSTDFAGIAEALFRFTAVMRDYSFPALSQVDHPIVSGTVRRTPLRKVMDTDLVVNNSTALVVSPLSVEVKAGVKYAFRAGLLVSSGATPGFKITVSLSGTGTLEYATTQSASSSSALIGGTATVGIGSASKRIMDVTGFATPTANGTLRIEFAQNVADPSNTTLLAPSWLELFPA